MWDGAINHIDMQALAPISHPKEMNSSIIGVVNKLNKNQFYRNLFFRAFNDSAITGTKILKALSQFQLTLVSDQSKYDKVKNGNDSFSKQEKNGYALFKKNCNNCHSEPLFSTYDFKHNGLKGDPYLKDYGRWNITKNKKDSMLFKTPSLRNLSYTFPYMHDGRFNTLYQVLDHYTTIQKENPLISNELKESIVLTENQKTDLVAFLLTLNDKKFVTNKNFQFPAKVFSKIKGTIN